MRLEIEIRIDGLLEEHGRSFHSLAKETGISHTLPGAELSTGRPAQTGEREEDKPEAKRTKQAREVIRTSVFDR